MPDYVLDLWYMAAWEEEETSLRAPVVPGETAKLTFFISDTADFALDSVAFLDGFHWLPFAPPIGAVKE